MAPESSNANAGTGQGVRIAIVDSGVNIGHPHICRPSCEFGDPPGQPRSNLHGIAGGVAIDPEGSTHPGYVDYLGHGTAVTAAIREKVPESDLFVVKVFDRALSTSITALVRAIEWAVESRVHVVNLSLGTARLEHEERLRAVVNRASDVGIVIVAAEAHGTVRWLPGILPNVISVRVDWSCPRREFRVWRGHDGLIFLASGFPRPIPGVPPHRNLNGISFAVANMTGFVARALAGSKDRSFANVIRHLVRAATCTDDAAPTSNDRIAVE